MYEIHVKGMTCGSCANAMTNVLQSIDPNVKVTVDLKSQTVRVESDQSEKVITALIEEIGFPVLQSKKVS